MYATRNDPNVTHVTRRMLMFILVAVRRLAFLNTEGFDRFGNNELFAPLIKWETFKEQVVSIRDYARSYENAYNGIQSSVERQDGITQIIGALGQTAKTQVDSEKTRLVEARRIAISEKGIYVAVSFGVSSRAVKNKLINKRNKQIN